MIVIKKYFYLRVVTFIYKHYHIVTLVMLMDKRDLLRLRFYREELLNAKAQLFKAKNIRQLKFLQDRIAFLQEKIAEIENNYKKR